MASSSSYATTMSSTEILGAKLLRDIAVEEGSLTRCWPVERLFRR